MAPGSESALERAATKWDVSVVHALMETLVDPMLSGFSAKNPPSADNEKSIARQMHAVVLLYNYYHRKQKLELEFLDFVSFCKLALSLRSSLILFMKMISVSDSIKLNGAENELPVIEKALILFMKMINASDSIELNVAKDELSVTEKAIKDACDIAMSLDASRDVPTAKGYPISKVAVLLIDSKKENCLLQFGAVTEGVWSLFEKEIIESSINQEILAEEKVLKKRKTNSQQASTNDSKFLQLGYDAVKDITGIVSSDLVVLETHVVYSLSKAKSAAQFYIMQCPQSFKIDKTVPLKFLVESLQGPLTEKFLKGWKTTTLVEYHHMLPYVGFISGGLSRKDSCLPTLNGSNARSTKNSDGKELNQSRIPALPLSEHSGGDLDDINWNSSESFDEVANENSEDSQKKCKHSSGGKIASSVNVFQSAEKHGIVRDEFRNRCDILDSAKKGTSRVSLKNVDKDSEKHERGSLPVPSRKLSQSIPKDDNGIQRLNMTDFTKTYPESEGTRKKLNSSIRVYHQRKNTVSSVQHDAHGLEDGVNFKVEIADLLKSNVSLCRDKKITAENGDVTISCDQGGIAATENAPVQLEALYNIEVESASASEDLHNALALLDRKRQKLYSQICSMEDELALYEHNIERIRDGGEVGLARQCIKSIISGSDHLLLKNELQVPEKGHQPGEDQNNPRSEKQTRFSDAFLPGKSSCQDLEYACLKNNWRLPRYFVQPSNGKFQSNAVVQSKDFNLSSKGGLESSPYKARESAAAQMIVKIQNASAASCN